ncbi:restriction endonuclease [Streptomyces cinereoruber]|uniref:restriction endonuclease n=1 Tax=Streptomyces cinereoruber TaxID=67260 RepID=UPI00363AE076
MDEAEKDILNEGTALSTDKVQGIYSKKWDEWHMPPGTGNGISSVDDGVVTVTVLEYAIAGTATVCEVSSFLNGRRLRHNVVVGEITVVSGPAPAATPAPVPAALAPYAPASSDYRLYTYSPENFAQRLADIDRAYRALVERLQQKEAAQPGKDYFQLSALLASLELRLQMLDPQAHQPLTPEERAKIPRWFLMSPTEFEHAIAALCRRDGCTDVKTPGGAGDLGADVIARTPDGRTLVVQCKRYSSGGLVGSPEVQKFAGTVFHHHKADIALFVTSSMLTKPAKNYARSAGIRVIESAQLEQWDKGSLRAPWTSEMRTPR